MTLKMNLGLLFITSLFFISCKEELEVQANPSSEHTPIIKNTNSQPAQQVIAPQPVPTVTTTLPGMNPPHGKPGHVCEIPVGAPLNSQPATVQQPITTQQPAPVITTTTTAPGMNPPHGEPGHICEIPVGSPLPK